MGRKRFCDWKLGASGAALSWKAIELAVVPDQPTEGAKLTVAGKILAQPLFGLPQIAVASTERVDSYARGCDLIVGYPCAGNRPVGSEVYWRWAPFTEEDATLDGPHEEGDQGVAELEDASAGSDSDDGDLTVDVGALELIYSLETLELDTQPNPHIVSQLWGHSIRYGAVDGDRGFVFTDAPGDQNSAWLIEQAGSKVLMVVNPSDLKRFTVTKSAAQNGDTEKSGLNGYQVDCELESDFLEKGVIRRLRLFAVMGTGGCESRLFEVAKRLLDSDIPLTA